MKLTERPRPRRVRPRPPSEVALTDQGRAMFEAKAARLREQTLPELLRAVAADPDDEPARVAYAEALTELRRVESVLAQAKPIAMQRRDPDKIGLGDRISVQFLDPPQDEPEEQVMLVHPFEAPLDLQRISVASPLGAAVLGHRLGEVVQFDAPSGRRTVRITARVTGR
jgi:transcription elongation factor GreA